MSNAPKKIEVVNGDGKDLEISEVSSHLNIAKPKIEDKKQNIVIPEEKKKIEKKNDKKDNK